MVTDILRPEFESRSRPFELLLPGDWFHSQKKWVGVFDLCMVGENQDNPKTEEGLMPLCGLAWVQIPTGPSEPFF